MASYGFPKTEHLCGDTLIGTLYAEGTSFIAYPLRVTWRTTEGESTPPARIMVSVPKKRFKRAVKRNLLKRRMREAYRLHKHPLWEAADGRRRQVHVAFQYVSDEVLPFDYIEKRMMKAIATMVQQLTEQPV